MDKIFLSYKGLKNFTNLKNRNFDGSFEFLGSKINLGFQSLDFFSNLNYLLKNLQRKYFFPISEIHPYSIRQKIYNKINFKNNSSKIRNSAHVTAETFHHKSQLRRKMTIIIKMIQKSINLQRQRRNSFSSGS